MNKGLIFFFGVVLGIGTGGFISNTFLKQKYEQRADEQIIACREAFLAESAKFRKEEQEKEDSKKYEAAAEAITKYSAEPEKAAEMIQKKKPYEISTEIYDDPANPYKTVGLIYFMEENFLMDENEAFISDENIARTIGPNALSLFEDRDTDQVIIRNEDTGCDYEINLSRISYAEWRQRHPNSGK